MEAMTERRCPVHHVTLEEEVLVALDAEVIVDRCPTCSGVFLDADELLELTADSQLNQSLRDRQAMDDASVRLCPDCGVRMSLEAARDLEVEVCPQCEGLWLDAGELEKLQTPGATQRAR